MGRKNEKRILSAVIFVMVIVLFSKPAFSGQDTQVISKAKKAVKAGQLDFAFIHYRSLLNGFPSSIYYEQALFANAEYYFFVADYAHAGELFRQYVGMAKDDDGKLFALVYLFKIAEIRNDKALLKGLERQIMACRPQGFLFSQVKEYNFESPLERAHKAVYDIDKVEIFIEGEKFAKISF